MLQSISTPDKDSNDLNRFSNDSLDKSSNDSEDMLMKGKGMIQEIKEMGILKGKAMVLKQNSINLKGNSISLRQNLINLKKKSINLKNRSMKENRKYLMTKSDSEQDRSLGDEESDEQDHQYSCSEMSSTSSRFVISETQDMSGLKVKQVLFKKTKYLRKYPHSKESISFREQPQTKYSVGSQTEDEYYTFKNKLHNLENDLKSIKSQITNLHEVKDNLLTNINIYRQTNKTLTEYFQLTCKEKDALLNKLRLIESVCYDKPTKYLVTLVTAILNGEQWDDIVTTETKTDMCVVL